MLRSPTLRLPKVKGLLDLKGFALAGFLCAGYFKADPRLSWVPIDLTVLFALLTLLCVCWEFMKNDFRLHKNLIWIVVMGVLFALPLFWTQWNSFASDKSQRFFTLTLLGAIAPFFLIRTKEDLRRFLHALTLLGLILSWNAAVVLISGGGQVDRLTSFGSNTISLGRAAGMSFVWIAVLAVDRRIGSLWAIGLLGFLGVIMLGSGSRGPLFAALGGVILLGIFHYWRNVKGILRGLAVLLFVGSVFAYGMTVAPPESTQRITDTLQGKMDDSSLMRIEAYKLSWRKIQDTPLGIGWGGFTTEINLWPGDDRQYPHDLFIEILLEGGWPAGLYFMGLLAFLLPKTLFKHDTPESRALFAMLFFFVVNASVSGDLNDNKELYTFLALSLCYRSEKSGTSQSGASDLRPSSF